MINSLKEMFDLDDLRTRLILEKKERKFLRSYSQKINLKNINTGIFWSEKLKKGYKKNPMKLDRIRRVAKLIEKKPGNLLNIGVGDGDLESNLKVHKFKKIGVDITLDGLKKANKNNEFFGVCASIHDLPFKTKFEVITVLEVLEHLFFTKIFKVLEDLKKLLKEDGKLIISVPINEKYNNDYNPNGHYRRYSVALIEKELKVSGFEVEEIIKLYAFHDFYPIKNFLSKYILKDRWKPNVVIIQARKK